jgi:hypothetical protein
MSDKIFAPRSVGHAEDFKLKPIDGFEIRFVVFV